MLMNVSTDFGQSRTGTIFVVFEVVGWREDEAPRCVEERCKRKRSVIGHDAMRCRSSEWDDGGVREVAY